MPNATGIRREGINVAEQTGQRPKVVVMGGGTGLSVMLRGLKEKPLDITAIVTVADDGGSSGILRNELQMPPPGDIRNVLTAMADVEPLMAEIMRYRFSSGEGLAGHSLGNLILAALTDISGDFVTAVREINRLFAVRGRVLPAAGEAVVLSAEMEDGSIVTGESKIPEAGGKIRRVFLEPPDVEPLPEALEAIRAADAILLGPGSLYTSILPNLLVPKLAEAVVASDAIKMFICNVMTQPGETDHYTVSDHLQAVYDHIGLHLFDYVIVNNGEIPPEVQQKYAEKGASPVELDREAIEDPRYKLIADRLVLFRTYLRHDTEKLSQHIYQLVQDWITRKR
ncbi:YvcK family protein [Paenibacillus sp. HN-1]|uniref:gluconeogenesis factor YvcK family protein n=1 Tax=Paenibacillus TaxID=44249 RepID=UPI001CAA321A|nr:MULTISPECIES: YvcK family protein [Paenibacillus]MBY9078961.1 YvcK family protein [Paenibacillus sp. CGMCC 1.18879]MBY9084361.1 YvcK family protein [Paenibacillus sinensis]